MILRNEVIKCLDHYIVLIQGVVHVSVAAMFLTGIFISGQLAPSFITLGCISPLLLVFTVVCICLEGHRHFQHWQLHNHLVAVSVAPLPEASTTTWASAWRNIGFTLCIPEFFLRLNVVNTIGEAIVRRRQ